MTDMLLKMWIRFQHGDAGATLVEYGIAITLAIALGVGTLTILANAIGGTMGVAAGQMPQAAP